MGRQRAGVSFESLASGNFIDGRARMNASKRGSVQGSESSDAYRIGAVAQLTGLSTDTIRAWERRYGLVEPTRTDTGLRVYSLADVQRLRTLELLSRGEACASEIAATFDEPLSTVSHRMKLLETSGLVGRRRDGRHLVFRLADDHVLHLVRDALDHAME